ncbi:MAG TPA: hypothetical protein VGS27_12445 [Candidatus Sulfotelmatobacter sp.]|nr:hypothetical protein [Candidatus Sulfotelmatobacter sp.]
MIDWTQFHSGEIRCPYCTDGVSFRLMVRQNSGDWYMCQSCGHLSLPSSPLHHCTCSKCAELSQKAGWPVLPPIRVVMRRLPPVGVPLVADPPKRGLLNGVQMRLRHMSRFFRRTGTSA